MRILSFCMRMVSHESFFHIAYLELIFLVALVTGQLSKEIKDMGREVERLFGALNEDLLKLQ